MVPETQYVSSGGIHIAYQVVGDGPVDLVYVPGWISHIELAWELPDLAAGLRRLASFTRLILFDKRGTGMSDRVPNDHLPTLEERMDDLRAVMDAVGSERAVVFGASEGGIMSLLFAATYPQRTISLCTFGSFSKRIWSPDYPWAPTPEERQKTYDAIERDWAAGFHDTAPSLDPERRARLITYYRRCASPGAAVALMKLNTQIDVRHVLPSIRVPTVVMHRRDDRDVWSRRADTWRTDPRGAFRRVPRRRSFLVDTGPDAIIDEIEELVTGTRPTPEINRVLTTVLFTDICRSTQEAVRRGDRRWLRLLGEHNELVRGELARFRGSEVNTAGDGFVATFDGPARAVRCACSIRDKVRQLGLEVRAGLHTGEIELLDRDIGGVAVHVGARVAAAAGAGEVLVSSTVKDLVSGSGIGFADRGLHTLKGVPGERNLFVVTA